MKTRNVGIAFVTLAAIACGPAIPVCGQNYEILSSTRNPSAVVPILTERLSLSQDQEDAVRAIVTADFETWQALSKKYRSDDSTDELSLLIERRRLTKETEGKILEILTEEQREAYEALLDEYLAEAQREARAKIADETILMMKDRLQLTEEQADIALPIIDQAMRERQALMQKVKDSGGPGGRRSGDRSAMRGIREEMERIDERTEERLSQVLTEDQMEEYRRIKKEEREKRRERMRSRMGGGSGKGGRRGGGG